MRSHEVERGQVVIVEGSPPEGLCVVVEGTFEATRQAGAEEVRLGDAGKGEVLGEMSILENRSPPRRCEPSKTAR